MAAEPWVLYSILPFVAITLGCVKRQVLASRFGRGPHNKNRDYKDFLHER